MIPNQPKEEVKAVKGLILPRAQGSSLAFRVEDTAAVSNSAEPPLRRGTRRANSIASTPGSNVAFYERRRITSIASTAVTSKAKELGSGTTPSPLPVLL